MLWAGQTPATGLVSDRGSFPTGCTCCRRRSWAESQCAGKQDRTGKRISWATQVWAIGRGRLRKGLWETFVRGHYWVWQGLWKCIRERSPPCSWVYWWESMRLFRVSQSCFGDILLFYILQRFISKIDSQHLYDVFLFKEYIILS